MPLSNDVAALTVAEFCRSLKIGKTHFYAEVKAGRIHIRKSGRRTLVPLSEQQAYLVRLPSNMADLPLKIFANFE